MTVKKPNNEAPLVFVALVGVPGEPRDFVVGFDRGLEGPSGSFGDVMGAVCPDGERKLGGIDFSTGCAAGTVYALATETRGVWQMSAADAWR